jgi:hypothetical protein
MALPGAGCDTAVAVGKVAGGCADAAVVSGVTDVNATAIDTVMIAWGIDTWSVSEAVPKD